MPVKPRNAPILLLAAALLAAATATLVLTAETTFLQDTWEFLMNRRGFDADALLAPHNEHLVVFPVLLEQLLLQLFGMTSARPEYLLLTVFLLVTACLLYVYIKRRVGPWPALFAAVAILFFGPAWEVLLWPFEITFVGPVLFGIAMLLALEREDRRGDIVACAFLIASLGFSGLGVPFAAAAAVVVLQGPRETWLARAYVVAVPAALFAAWYLGWGHEAETHASIRSLLGSPRLVADAMAAAIASLLGLGTNPVGGSTEPVWGRAILIALVVALGYRQLRRPAFFPGLWPVAAAAAAYWFLMAFNQIPGRDVTSSRYQYAGAVFVLMIAANLFKGVRPGSRAQLLLGAVTALAVAPNLVVLKQGSEAFELQSVLTRADTGAIEIARRTVDPEFRLTPEVAGTPTLIDISAGEYLEAVAEHGSPAYSPAELASAPALGRRQADIVLSQALPLSTVTTPGAFGSSAGGEGCVTLPAGDSAKAEVVVPAGVSRIELAGGPPAAFSLRRFASGEYPVSTEGVPGGSSTLMRVPRDAAVRPWRLHVEASQRARVCHRGRFAG
jgi:hypothetical protein